MKKKIFIFSFFIFTVLLFFKFNYGYCSDFTSLREITDPYKPWIVEFNQPYDHEDLISNTFTITLYHDGEDYRTYIPVELFQESDTKLKITPKSGYLYDIEYTLQIYGYSVKNIDGNSLNKVINLPFKLIGGNTPISFEDAVLEDIVRKTIDKKTGTIYKKDVQEITGFHNISDKGKIHSLKGIENLVNLEYLDISTNRIKDISPLLELKNLQSLSLNSTYLEDHRQITDLQYINSLHLYNLSSKIDMSFLEEIPTLKSLGISYSDIKDYSFLYPLQNLNSLALYSNEIKDISFITNLPNLEILNFNSNAIEDISPLSSLTNLKELYLSKNIISSLAPLEELTKLTEFVAEYNFIEDLEGLKNCSELEYLYLRENNIKDISYLPNIPNIQYLDLSNNIISDISILETLDQCSIVYLYGNPILDISHIIANGEYNDFGLSLDKIQAAGIKAHQIIDEIIREDMTDLEKERVIYNYLIDNVEYDDYYYTYGIETKEDPGNIYGTLIHGWAICDGYAHAMKVLGRLAGLDCIYIMGDVINRDSHAWNMINLDGKYYHLDATWSDGGNNLPTDYSFLNISDFEMMNFGQRIWSIDYPKTEEFDEDYKKYCIENNISFDDIYIINGELSTNTPIDHDILIRLNLNILDKDKDIIYAESKYFTIPSGFINIEYDFIVPGYNKFTSYTMDYELYYTSSNQSLLDFGYVSKSGTTPYKDRQHIFELDEKIDINILNYSNFDPYIDDYKLSYDPDSPWGDLIPYLITNVNDIVLPPYSAILYSVDHHIHEFMGFNTQGFGDILTTNHRGENKIIKNGEILAGHPGILSGMSIYYSIIMFDADFDEEDLRIKGTIDMDNVVYSGRWVYDGVVPKKDSETTPPTDDPIVDVEDTTIHNGNQINTGAVIEKDGYYYFTETIDGYIHNLMKVSIDTGERYNIYEGTASYLQTSENYLYFSDSQKGLLRVNLDTNVLETFIHVNKFIDGFSGWYYINDGEVYYNSRSGQNLYRIDMDTLDANMISDNRFGDLNVVGDYIYYTNGNKRVNISRYNLISGIDEVFAEVQASNLTSNGQYLYYSLYEYLEDINEDAYSIYRADISGKNPVLIYQTQSPNIAKINIDDYGNLYISIYYDGVYKISLKDPSKPIIEKISDNPNISFIIIGEKNIYLLDYSANEPIIINHGD